MVDKVTLYIATHAITGKKYFGKTICYFTKEELQKKYHGSGEYWNKHLNKHGDYVLMEIYRICSLDETDEDYVKPIALKFSEENDIVKSTDWANMIPENGLDGIVHTQETRNKIGRAGKNKIISIEQKELLSEQASRKVCCLNCKVEVNYCNFKRYHQGDKCFDDKSFRKVCCLNCNLEIGVNNFKSHTSLCFDGISLSKSKKFDVCPYCNKEFNSKGIKQHTIVCSVPKKEIIKIKKSSCCLYCAKDITNANINRHLDSCCPKQDNKLLVFTKFNDQNASS